MGMGGTPRSEHPNARGRGDSTQEQRGTASGEFVRRSTCIISWNVCHAMAIGARDLAHAAQSKRVETRAEPVAVRPFGHSSQSARFGPTAGLHVDAINVSAHAARVGGH
eukprot:1814299-Prymnesium_polylepis.1